MIRLIKNTFYNDKKTRADLAKFVLQTDKLSMGDQVAKFESEFALWQGRVHAVMFNSGSSANLALIQAVKNLNLIKGKIAVSGLTWATNVMPLFQLGYEPVPIDIDVDSLNISLPMLYQSYAKHKFRALFLTNALGFSTDLDSIIEWCDHNNVLLLEDNCESLGSERKKKLGNYGFASTFSFFVGHHLSTIEGGMVCTDSKELYEALIMVRAHGWTRNLCDESRLQFRSSCKIEKFYEPYSFFCNAYNLRPTDMQGFLGLNQLQYVEEIINKRYHNFLKFHEATMENNELWPLDIRKYQVISAFALPIICTTPYLRKVYIDKFEQHGIECRPVISGNITRQPFWINQIRKKYELKNTDFVHERGLYVSNDAALSKVELSKIIGVIKG